MGIIYYHRFIGEVHQLATYYFLALNLPSLPCLVTLGLDPGNIWPLPDGAVFVSIKRGHWRDTESPQQRQGLFTGVWDAFLLYSPHPQSVQPGALGKPKGLTLQGISLPLSRLLRIGAGPPTCSTKIQPSGLLLQTGRASALATSRPHIHVAVTSSSKGTDTQSWGWQGASCKLLETSSCTLLRRKIASS